jgi:hypothetical protein
VNERHERLIDGLLTLADSEHEITERTSVDLADIAEYVLEALPAGGPAGTSLLDPAPVVGDPVLLERLVQNLVENAVRHNVPDGWLRIETATVHGQARLVVTNSGPVVPGVRDGIDLPALPPPGPRADRRPVPRPRPGPGPVHRARDRPGPPRHRHGDAPPGRRPHPHHHPPTGVMIIRFARHMGVCGLKIRPVARQVG